MNLASNLAAPERKPKREGRRIVVLKSSVCKPDTNLIYIMCEGLKIVVPKSSIRKPDTNLIFVMWT